MEESTTTANEPEDTGASAEAPAEPVTAPEEAAASQPPEPAASEPSTDENLEWLQNKGIDPQSPEAISKLAEMARNAEKKMHESTTKASELEKTLTTSPPEIAGNSDVEVLAQEVRALKLSQNVKSFFDSNPEAKALEEEMTKIVTDRPEMASLVTEGYLTLDDLYSLAKGGDTSREEKLKSDGGREALQKVASKQQAKAVVGAATNSDLSDSTPDDPFLKGLSGKSA